MYLATLVLQLQETVIGSMAKLTHTHKLMRKLENHHIEHRVSRTVCKMGVPENNKGLHETFHSTKFKHNPQVFKAELHD